jgi:pyruvate kinase
MVEMSLKKGKICIVATQVLDSMIKNPRPTRAEVTDAGNAVLDGTCAISMSGETAYGDYPVEATEMMARIMKYTEEKIGELVHFKELPTVDSVEYKKAKEIVEKANSENSKMIVVLGGNTEITRAISAFRPKSVVVPVIDEWSVREFGLAYGVRGVTNIDELKKDGDIKSEDNILVVDGESLGYSVKKFSDL